MDWTDAGKQSEDITLKDVIEYVNFKGVLQRGDYLKTIKNWRSVFPANQLFIEYYENVKKKPVNLLIDVFKFLKVAATADFNKMPVNTKKRWGSQYLCLNIS